ncbi:MAG: phage major capsid protein, partial [Muribaculaceae bacterium]|nr:phage major capsid protein [Muribaculaceae bacterium]
NYIGKGNIGLGDWRYQPLGLFGDMSFVIDPFSHARKDAVDFVFNVNYGTTTLRKEAFVLGKTAE